MEPSVQKPNRSGLPDLRKELTDLLFPARELAGLRGVIQGDSFQHLDQIDPNNTAFPIAFMNTDLALVMKRETDPDLNVVANFYLELPQDTSAARIHEGIQTCYARVGFVLERGDDNKMEMRKGGMVLNIAMAYNPSICISSYVRHAYITVRQRLESVLVTK
ncbi:hypothetical protein HYS47_02135 [Candidatus Woesearchaeota archaeon]|nr:hypothetical protein [Candidatus Woesearchaeota archaeon]